MGAVSVAQIILTPLKRISVTGGDVLHAIKRNDVGFIDFGEAYLSHIEQGSIKAWKRHIKMTLNLVVPIGTVQFVFIDSENKWREETIGTEHYVRLTVPPGIWFGFRGLTSPYSLLLNIADIPHDPAEIERKNKEAFMFDWEKQ